MKVKKEVSTENKIELSIITINYNGADFILKLWNSLEEFVDNSFELIIVDNNSSVQNLEKLDKISQEKNTYYKDLEKKEIKEFAIGTNSFFSVLRKIYPKIALRKINN